MNKKQVDAEIDEVRRARRRIKLISTQIASLSQDITECQGVVDELYQQLKMYSVIIAINAKEAGNE